MQLKNVPDLVSTCLVLHNLCIIFGDNFWNDEWIREATEDVQSGLSAVRAGISMREKVAVANSALHSLAGIDENSREGLEYMKQEATVDFEIQMGTGGQTFQELSARRNSLAKILWKATTKASIDDTFIADSV